MVGATDYAAWKAKLVSPEYNQSHLFAGDLNEETQKSIIHQLVAADRNYPGGLLNYLNRARKLLADSKSGVNPFDGYKPETPSCLNPAIGSEEFYQLEESGLKAVSKCAFVLVAGGLGERLGYPEIKISLMTNSLVEVTYCEWYFRCIRHFEKLSGETVQLPVVIMTSGDTHASTVRLLEKHDYFCLKQEQVTLVMQEKVPALIDADARLSLKDGKIETKPHGHGDVHTLLHQHGLAKKWQSSGFEWVFFFQDTNALTMRAVPVCLGISKAKNFSMNSLCIPRTPCDAVGGICRLVKTDGSGEMTVNVEYNQLDALLKSAGLPGDVAAPGSQYSPYPGNCNILLFRLADYAGILEETGGAVPEFVNPKYADSTKTKFKSATRVECMMQEFAQLWKPGQQVGATVLDRWFCFSTVKNNIKDAATKIASKLSGESAFTADAEFYYASAKCLEIAASKAGNGCQVNIAPAESVSFHNMTASMGPKIYLDPSFGLTVSEMAKRLQRCRSIKISAKSGLALEGPVSMSSLDLDGVLMVKSGYGELEMGDVKVVNGGVETRTISPEDERERLEDRVRGYCLAIV
eukprot:Protomagalhaensia_wolfi_Nauph_80__4697@NODE_486_length_2443_cov_408_004576_g366_i0_p1_GENE_NODE_486_length_2443_cov_408_004576_g366_i0NODE_486_length_2443_cov_408_004576_g366_i0_p1_ORF_typecomplete_len592_score163_80UDPGP/PF01704_18/1_4e70_NODE_486_length_2443_cov_408_004576_g366_i0441777